MKQDQQFDEYMKEISKFKSLSSDEENELLDRIDKNKKDDAVMTELTQSYLPFVVEIASEYSKNNKNFTVLDLIQEGNLGLFSAIAHYRHAEGRIFKKWAEEKIRNQIELAMKSASHELPDPQKIEKFGWQGTK